MKLLQKASIVILLLIASWNIPVSRAAWDFLDAHLFFALNPLTAHFPRVVKGLNSSLFDWFSDIIILGVMIRYFLHKDEKPRSKKIAEFVYIALIAALTIALVNKRFLPDVIHAKRVSPSILLSPSVRLSTFFPGVKDASHSCFPGDHATTAFFFLISYCYFTSVRRALPVALYAICMILPRLIVGAHWLTDVVMGSFCIALGSFAIAFGTPFHAYCVPRIQKIVEGVPKLYGRFTRALQ